MKRLIVRFTLIFHLFLAVTSCKIDSPFKDSNYNFFRVVLINNKVPIVRLTSNSLDGNEVVLDVSKYDVRITSPVGDDEFAQGGKFRQTICKPGVPYSIYWKLKTETLWHSLQKEIPTELSQIKQSNLQKNSESIFIDTIENPKGDAFFYEFNYFPDLNNPQDVSLSYITGFSFIHKNYGSAFIQGKRLQLWPSINSDFEDRGFTPCVQPFNWQDIFSKKMFFLSKENFVLHQVSKKDFELINQLKKNHSNTQNPLYIGSPSSFDYQVGNMIGHAFAYFRYNDVHIENVIPKENVVTFELQYYGKPIDVNTIKISSVVIDCDGTNAFPQYQWTGASDTLFFEDYFKNHYNNLFQKPCGFQQNKYKFKVGVGYEILSTRQSFYFQSEELVYDVKPNRLIINIQ
jgi:hypothetical protein